MTRVARVTISLPKDLILFTGKLAEERKTSRSKVIASCLRETAERRALAELEEGYRVMAEENRKLAKMTFELQRRAVPEWKGASNAPKRGKARRDILGKLESGQGK